MVDSEVAMRENVVGACVTMVSYRVCLNAGAMTWHVAGLDVCMYEMVSTRLD